MRNGHIRTVHDKTREGWLYEVITMEAVRTKEWVRSGKMRRGLLQEANKVTPKHTAHTSTHTTTHHTHMHTQHHITATHVQIKLRQTLKNNYKTPASFVQHPGPLQLSLFTQNTHVENLHMSRTYTTT